MSIFEQHPMLHLLCSEMAPSATARGELVSRASLSIKPRKSKWLSEFRFESTVG